MFYLKFAILISSVLWMTACSTLPKTPVPFHQLGKFTTYPLNTHYYQINFEAPARMSQGAAEEITFLKSAQMTVKLGFQYFKVIPDPTHQPHSPRQTIVYRPVYYPYGYHSPLWYDPIFDSPQVVVVDPVYVSYRIELFKQDEQPKDAFDARLILQNLGQKYGVSVTGESIDPPVSKK